MIKIGRWCKNDLSLRNYDLRSFCIERIIICKVEDFFWKYLFVGLEFIFRLI